MAGVQSPVLLPSKFRPQSTETLPLGVKDREAYDEIVSNYAALKAKVNTALALRADTVRHGSVVDFTRNYLGAVGLQAMTSLLAKNENLRELYVPSSGLNNDSVVFFCRTLVKHPRLARIDLSCNTISLAAGLAILSMLQQNQNVVEVNLSETQVPHAVMNKIEQKLQRNRALAKQRPPSATADAAALVSRSTDRGFPTIVREQVRAVEWARQEEEVLERLTAITETVAAAHHKYVPAPHPDSGWRLLDVAILAPPFLFESEVALLVRHVFPRLNEELVGCKVHLIPPVDPPDQPAGTSLRNLRFAIAADVLRNVEKSRLLTIELIGDRAGDYEQLPANEIAKRPALLHSLRQRRNSADSVHADSAGAPPLRPVMYTAHERATEVSSWLIIATRRDTRKIGVPSSLAPLLTEELPVEHPDYLQQQVLRTVSVGSDAVCAAQKIQCDAAVKDKKWRAHQNFREKALETAPVQELVIRNYKATFDHCTEEGQVHLKNLEEFAEAIYERMRLILMAHFPPCMDGHPTFFQRQNVNKFAARKLQLFQERLQAFLLSCVDHALAKKSITNRLDLYVITPPSRNAFVLHGAEPAAVTALIGAFTSGLMTKEPQKYRVAFHTTRSPLLTEEPTELREIICHIILQLCPDEEVYQQAIKEVDMKCLQKLFAEVLTEKTKPPETFTGSKGNRSENSITVVVLDGLDCVLPPVTPCAALRVSEETGKDVWDAPVSPLLPRKQQYQEEDPFAYIPHCLSRNVRLVLGCETDSDLHHRLESRGRDSVELLPMGPMTPNDFDEMLRPTVMSKFGVTLSDDDFVLIRKKEEALSPEYITLVVDALRSFNEAPGVETQAVIASLPGTVKEMVQQVYSNLRKCFGFPHIRKCSWLLMCSRWGIYEPQLRAMLQLPQQRFNQLMRMMRPLLEHSTPSILGIEGGNALHVRVCIRSRAFRELLEREDLRNEESENDHKVWHDMLVHCYLNVVHEVIGREQTPPIFGLLSTSPYERMAVKELLYHAVQADTRHIVHRLVLSMPYLMLVYRNGLGYHLVRDLIAAFNAFFVLYELGEYADDNEAERGEMPTSLSRLRDYIYFLRQNNARLMEFPHLVLQVAIESAARFRFVGGDAREYVARCMSHHAPVAQRRVVFFEVIDNARSTIHHGAVTACVFAPRAKRIITGSADRSVCSVNPATGAVAVQARQAPTRVEVIVYCETGAYHAAVCHDRTLLIYDSAQMRLVSRCDGGVFGAPLASVVFSARGRFYIVATEDLHVRVFETERSLEMLHVDQRQFLSNSGGVSEVNLLRGYAAVVPHRVEDEVFYVTCHNVVNMWKLTPTRDEFLHEMSFELPFTVDSGKAVMSGTHLLLHPAPLPVPADGHRPAPRLMRICSIAERREVAVLTSPCSQLLYQFSVDEKLVACALDDGSLTVYRVPWACLQDGQVNLMSIVPFVHFSAFCESPVPTVQALRFRGNSAGLFALGNSTMMKYWALPRKMGRTSGGDSVDSEEQQEADEWDVAEEEQEDEILVGVADGEFVLAADEATAWDVTQASPTREAEIVFGDASGRLTMLRMWSPLM